MNRLAAFTGSMMISLSAILVRLADTTPSTAALLRVAYATPLLWILWRLTCKSDLRSARDRGLAFVSGMILAADLVMWHQSIALIGAGLSTVLANTQVVFVAAAAWIFHRERPSLRAFLTIPVIFAGVVMISGLSRPDAHGIDPIGGTIFGVLAGICYAAFLMLFRASNKKLSASAGPLLDATLGATVATLAWGMLSGSLNFDLPWRSHAWLLTLAIVPHIGGWLLITRALPRLPALQTSIVLLLQPMITVLWALLIFGEWLSVVQWTGVGLVLAGVGWLLLGDAIRPVPAPLTLDSTVEERPN